MKSLILVTLLILSTSAMAFETLTGKFTLNKTAYELTISYDLPNNQEASSKGVRYFGSSTLPESGEIFPAFCNYYMSFPVSYNVVIKIASTQVTVYSKVGTEFFQGSAGGGLHSENKCTWVIDGWAEKVATRLRMTDASFKIGNLSYRYFIDTYSLISAKGSADLSLTAEFSTPGKGNDGKNDGEVWIDTQPTADGDFQRIWFPLSL